MSRLDSFIRRMSAQRDILDGLADRLDPLPGPILEFGYGSGRTYDHLCGLFPKRRIVVFESVAAVMRHAPVQPADMVIGAIEETAARWPDGCAALIHADIETGEATFDATLAAWLPALIARLLRPGGYAASGCALPDPRLLPQALPPGVGQGRYHLVRRA